MKLFPNSVYFYSLFHDVCLPTNPVGCSFDGGHITYPASFHWCPCKTLKTHNAPSLFVRGSPLRAHPICVNWIPSCSLHVAGHPESHYWNFGDRAGLCYFTPEGHSDFAVSCLNCRDTDVNCCRQIIFFQMDLILLWNCDKYEVSLTRLFVFGVLRVHVIYMYVDIYVHINDMV